MTGQATYTAQKLVGQPRQYKRWGETGSDEIRYKFATASEALIYFPEGDINEGTLWLREGEGIEKPTVRQFEESIRAIRSDPDILKHLEGKYIAMMGGTLVDIDEDFSELINRVFAEDPIRKVSITKITPGRRMSNIDTPL